jgi:hypothetical protein
MGSRFVVVVDELDKDAFEVTLVSDEQPVQAFDPHGANESLGECVRARCSDRRIDHACTDRGHHFVEGTDELRVAIANQELDGATLVLEHGCEVARLLGDPAPDRVLGHTSEEDLAALEIDEEQDIDLSKARGVDGEEVARERAGSLGAKELCPRRTRSAWCRFEAMTSKHVPDTSSQRRRRRAFDIRQRCGDSPTAGSRERDER